MKKSLIVLLCLFILTIKMNAQTNDRINFHTEIIKNGSVQNGKGKSPVCPPTVLLNDYTLYFQASHPEFVLNILVDDEIVYTCIVNTNVTTLELPSFLLGEYEIQLIAEPYCFIGYITL